MVIPIKNLLPQSINKAGISDQVSAAVICEEFDKIVVKVLGDKSKGKAKALYLKNGTLTVAVLSSVMGQELKLHEAEILKQVEKKAGENVVTRLRFFV